MPKLLTIRKQAWVERRNPDVVRGTPLNNPFPLEARYAAALIDLVNKMTVDVERQIKKMFDTEHAEQFFAEDATVSSQARILTNALIRKYATIFGAASKPLATRMVDQADKSSSVAVHSSVKQLSGGLSLPTKALTADMTQVLAASITENVGLIKSISTKYLEQVQGDVMRSITTGNGLADLVPALEKQKDITQRRAVMIARDQTRKAYNNLNRGRMQNLGLKKFEWLHTGGSAHPRKLHESYNGKIFSFDDLPVIDDNTGERGIPGQAINCRCRMLPVIEFED